MTTFDANVFFEAYKSAVLNKDVEGLMALYDKDVLAFDVWDAWSLLGDGQWREMTRDWLESLGSESVVVEFEDIRTFQGGDIAGASAFGIFKAVSETGEILRSMRNRLTWVAARKGDGWKIVHQHTSVPIDSKALKAILHR
jgi:ketosteroid isomerase-like protein